MEGALGVPPITVPVVAKDGVVAFGNALPSCRTFSSTSQLHFAPRSTAPHPTSDWIRCLRGAPSSPCVLFEALAEDLRSLSGLGSCRHLCIPGLYLLSTTCSKVDGEVDQTDVLVPECIHGTLYRSSLATYADSFLSAMSLSALSSL